MEPSEYLSSAAAHLYGNYRPAPVVMAKGKGMVLMDLARSETLVGVAVVDDRPLIVSGAGRGGKPASIGVSVREQANFRGNRARRGTELPTRLKPAGLGLA